MKQNTLIILTLWILIFIPFKSASQTHNELVTESFDISIDFGSSGRKTIPVQYDIEAKILFPVIDIFNYLKIAHTVQADRNVIVGYIFNENDKFEINLAQQFITYKGKKTTFDNNDINYDGVELFIRQYVIENAFGFNLKFDFNSMTAKMSAENDFPIAKLNKIEKARQNIRLINQTENYDTLLNREYHLFNFGMADWSISGNRQGSATDEVRAGIGVGAEVLGGETNLWLNFSSLYGLKRNQQRYYWKWVDNNFKPLRQAQIGRVHANSTATLLTPMDGFFITNTPSTVRKALGDYVISDYTNPDWIVELYINNTLISYTNADASGFYTFKVPIVYGTNRITLRFYGPNGEERSEEKIMSMPYNLLPAGEFEYRVTGGIMLDAERSKYTRAETSYGVYRGLTVGGGCEYLSSIIENPNIPFANVTWQAFSKLMLTAEYAHKVRMRAALNYNFSNNVLDMNYTRYEPGQRAILYNYKEQYKANLSIPYMSRKVGGLIRAGFNSNVYENFSFNNAELTLTANSGPFSANFQNMANWIENSSSNVYANLTFGYRFWKNAVFRPSIQYNYTNNSIISYKAALEKRVLGNGYLSMMYENFPVMDHSSFNIAFRYDLSFMSTYLSTHLNQNTAHIAFSARGGTAYGSGNNYIHTDAREQVGRSGIAIMAFVDKNFNNVKDDDEFYVSNISVRCNGGKVVKNAKDSITRIVGLEPFTEYILQLDESTFQNISWKLAHKKIKVLTDPNQFKKISVPIYPMGEVSGMVIDDSGNGKGRILVEVLNDNGEKVASALTESDGYFSYLGLKPGNYTLRIDTLQQKVLNLRCTAQLVTIHEDSYGSTIDVGDVKVVDLTEKIDETQISKNDIHNQLLSLDSLLSYSILFDLDKTTVRTEYKGNLLKLADLLKLNRKFVLEIQGHTDGVGTQGYNLKLSEKRAQAVKDELLKLGVDTKQLTIKGFGKLKPAASNSTAAGRAMNRRVVFKSLMDNAAQTNEGKPNRDESKNKEDINKRVVFSNDTTKMWLSTHNMYSIFYGKDRFSVRNQHKVLLNAVGQIMKRNPDLKLVVESFADSDGASTYNKVLTDKRSAAVVEFLSTIGVDTKRIQVESYGQNKPFNDNANEVEKLTNRRTVFTYYRNGEKVNLDNQIFAYMKNNIKSNVDQLYIRNMGNDKYMIQVGAFRSEHEAKEIADKLFSIFSDNIYVIQEDGYYKIRVGYFPTLQEALKTRTFIQASMVLDN